MNDSFFDTSFWQNFLSNALATVLGAMLGIPIALGLDRKIARQRETEDAKKQKEIAQERKKNVLELLRAELDTNREILELLIEKQEEQPGISVLIGMKNVLWRAFSDSSELHWIDNPFLINKISHAYYYINGLVELERRYSDPYFKMRVFSLGGKNTYAGERVVDNVQSLRPDALAEIVEAINAIDTELEPKPP